MKEELDLRRSNTNINQITEVIVNPTKADQINMTEVEHIVDVNEVQCVYASVDDKGNGKSNIEIAKDEDIDLIKAN